MPVGPNPALAALAGMLANATPPPAPPGMARMLADRILALLHGLGRAARGDRTAAGDVGRPELAMPSADSAIARPLQPVPPPGPLLTLDPIDGTIVLVDDALRRGGDGDGTGGHGSDADQAPSSWVPVTSALRLLPLRLREAHLADRIDALLREVGLTRLQLLLATVVGPPIVVLVVATVAELVGS